MARPTGSVDGTKRRRVSKFSAEARKKRMAAKARMAKKEQADLLKAEALKGLREALASGEEETALGFCRKMLNGEPIPVPARVDKTAETEDDAEVVVEMRYYLPTIEDMKWATQTMLPYMAPKLNAVDVSGKKDGESHEDWSARVMEEIDKEIADDDDDSTPTMQ